MRTYAMVTKNIMIAPAPDCPAFGAEPPPVKPEKLSRAALEFACLQDGPYKMDHRVFTHHIHLKMAEISGRPAKTFDDFHASGQPCMRTSPLTKRYGWAAHYDTKGRLALLDPASAKFKALAGDVTIAQKPALRSKAT